MRVRKAKRRQLVQIINSLVGSPTSPGSVQPNIDASHSVHQPRHIVVPPRDSRTGDALEDPDRLYGFLLKRDLGAAERALVAIERALNLLAFTPFSCRKALLQKNPRWRELLIPFGHSGYVALFEIEDEHTVTVTAVRHQREEDYH
jgi:plasmid stabilization system protein ParE